MHVHSKDGTLSVAVDREIVIKMQLVCDMKVNCLMKGRYKLIWHQEVEASGISRQSAHRCGKVVSPTYRPVYRPHPSRKRS